MIAMPLVTGIPTLVFDVYSHEETYHFIWFLVTCVFVDNLCFEHGYEMVQKLIRIAVELS